MNIKMNLSIYVILFITLLMAILGGVYFYWFKLESHFDPDPMILDIAEDRSISFDIDIEIAYRCLYEVGIGIGSKRSKNGHKHIRELFGGISEKHKIPMILDVKIINVDGDVIVDIKDYSDFSYPTNYAPNPVKFFLKRAVLQPAIYQVEINANQVEEKISEFEVFFFVQHMPKAECS